MLKGEEREDIPPSQQQSAEQKQKAAEAEKAYKAALDKIPEQKFDPWAKMR